MQDVKNSLGKLVCRIDTTSQLVEIVHKGIVTTVQFVSNGQVEVINSKAVKAA